MTNSHYNSLNHEQLQDLFSQFLVDRWSYSSVTGFARNEKAFEMQYIYGMYGRKSATAIAGSAYHAALQFYFEKKKEGIEVDVITLEQVAFEYIESVEANKWKLQKTTPTVEEAQLKANKTAIALIRNFYLEKGVYEDNIKEVLYVELELEEFLVVNGVDIPLPCRAKLDLVVRTKDDKIAIADHKSKATYTSDDEAALAIGVQAITYVLQYEAEFEGSTVEEVWFVENKHSANKDKSPQLKKIMVEIDDNTRKLYEALLYEPLKRLIQAVRDPDYIYLINDYDNLTDRAELYEFWAKTQISEIEDFNIADAKKDLIGKRLKKIRDSSIATINPKVVQSFKANASKFIQYNLSSTNMNSKEKIEHVLKTFSIPVEVAHTFEGYSSNTYLLNIGAGTKVASIHQHRLDIANALDVASVRIAKDLVVHEGKSYVAVDFSKKREKSLDYDPKDLHGMKIPLGRDNFGNVIYWDLENNSTPHALVCGATGSGKSVCITTIIEAGKAAGINTIVIFDPKFEFTEYHNGKTIFVFSQIEEIEEQMRNLIEEMQYRVKNRIHEKTLVIFDEFADAVANSAKGNELKIYERIVTGFYNDGREKTKVECVGEHKSLEQNLKMLLQKGRSSGYRVVAATQRASVQVITGDAKVNFPVQICFRVPKETDSRVVIDEPGAEALAGQGDGLIKSPEYNDVVRFQAYYTKPQFSKVHE